MADSSGGSVNPLVALSDELRALHQRSGRWSSRQLAAKCKREGYALSHSAVAEALTPVTGPMPGLMSTMRQAARPSAARGRLPRWATIEILVKVMGGDVPYYQRLWEAAADATAGVKRKSPPPAPKVDSAQRGAAGAVVDPDASTGPVPDGPSPKAGTDVLRAEDSRNIVLGHRHLDYSGYSPDAPPDIQLLKVGWASGIDLNRLLWQIIYNAPKDSTAAYTMVAQRDFAAAMEMAFTLLRRDPDRAADLLVHLAVGQPDITLSIIRELLTSADVKAKWLLRAAIRAVEVGAAVEVAALTLLVLLRQGDGPAVVVEFGKWASPGVEVTDPGELANRRAILGSMIAEIMVSVSNQRAAVALLDDLWQLSHSVAADVFMRVVHNPVTKKNRHDHAGNLLLGVLARRSEFCALMVLASRTRADRVALLGAAILDLAEENLAVAGHLASRIAQRSSMTVMQMFTSNATRDTVIAGVLCAAAGEDLESASRVAAAWLGSSYPAVRIPMGKTLVEMAAQDPQNLAAILTTVVGWVPAKSNSEFESVSGLDNHAAGDLLRAIDAYTTFGNRRKIRRLL